MIDSLISLIYNGNGKRQIKGMWILYLIGQLIEVHCSIVIDCIIIITQMPVCWPHIDPLGFTELMLLVRASTSDGYRGYWTIYWWEHGWEMVLRKYCYCCCYQAHMVRFDVIIIIVSILTLMSHGEAIELMLLLALKPLESVSMEPRSTLLSPLHIESYLLLERR